MALFRTHSASLASRPIRQLIDLWMLIVLFITVKCMPGGVDKRTIWNFTALGAAFAAVWMIGRSPRVRRLMGRLLGEPTDERSLAASFDVSPREEQPAPGGRRWPWLAAGLIFCVLVLAGLQWRQTNYFVQDDNLTQFLPVVLQGCRSLFNDGVFPVWNPHQFLGSPTASLGTYALTYPPTYLSYAVARWLIGNEYATLDVFCIAHLLAGYLTAWWAFRTVGVRPSLAAAGSVCFALSGFFLIAGRSWYYMTPTAAWLPLLVVSLERFRRRQVDWKWVAGTAAVIGALFHAGNAQMWAYAMLLYSIGLAMALASRAAGWREALPALSAVVLGAGLAMPLLVPQFLETAEIQRRSGDGAMLRYMLAIFLPYPLAEARYPGVTETPDLEHMGHLYYAGTVFSAAGMLVMLSLIAYRWNRTTLARNVWCVLGWVALLFALGRIGVLWYLISKVPPFNDFTHSFKFMPFVTLFMLVAGALALERWMRLRARPRRYELLVCGAIALLMGYHAWRATPSFCDYAFRPYPELPAEMEALRDKDQPQRIYAIAARRSLAPEYSYSMMHQLPSIWGLHSFEGYDPLVRRGPRFGSVMDKLFTPARVLGIQVELGPGALGLEHTAANIDVNEVLNRTGMDEVGFWGKSFRIELPQALQTLRAYGVRWVVIYSGPLKPSIGDGNPNEIFWRTDPVAEQVGEMVKERAHLVLRRPEVQVYELAGVAPLAFAQSKPRTGLPIEFNGAGLEVDLTDLSAGGEVVVNVVESEFMTAATDLGKLTPTPDKWGRMVFDVPPGAKTLRVRYSVPWLAGCVLGGVLAAVGLGIMLWRTRIEGFFQRHRRPTMAASPAEPRRLAA